MPSAFVDIRRVWIILPLFILTSPNVLSGMKPIGRVMSFVEKAALAIFGGLLGAAFGVANWEIVSKRILHVPVNGTSA